MKIKNILWVTSLFFAFQSCQKLTGSNQLEDSELNLKFSTELSSISSNLKVSVKNGILHFNDTATFFKDVEILSKMSDEEFRSFEKSIGFKS